MGGPYSFKEKKDDIWVKLLLSLGVEQRIK